MLRIRGALVAFVLAAALPGCKIIKTPTPEEKAAAAARSAFDPAAKVEAIWQSKVVPGVEKRASDLKTVLQAVATNPDDAGAKYGNPRKQSSSPWTYAVKLSGKIVAADTASRAGTLDVDVDGDGKVDAKVQIGPAVRGTALRDALISWTSTNSGTRSSGPNSAKPSMKRQTRPFWRHYPGTG